MSCSHKSGDASGSAEPSVAFVAGAGVEAPVQHDDPFAAWAALMELVEALCPEWPARAPMRGNDFRI